MRHIYSRWVEQAVGIRAGRSAILCPDGIILERYAKSLELCSGVAISLDDILSIRYTTEVLVISKGGVQAVIQKDPTVLSPSWIGS